MDAERDVPAREAGQERGVRGRVSSRGDRAARAAVRERHAHAVGRHHNRANLALVDEGEQLGEGEVSRRVAAAAHAEEDEQRDGGAPGCDDESFTRPRAA